MLEFGFELELVVKKGKAVVMPPTGFPTDGCAVLVEARGKPSSDPLTAAFSLLEEIERLGAQLPPKHRLERIDSFPIGELAEAVARTSRKEPVQQHCIYDPAAFQHTPKEEGMVYAGLHTHFSNLRKVHTGMVPSKYLQELVLLLHEGAIRVEEFTRRQHSEGTVNEVAGLLNIPRIVQQMDAAFEAEIKASNRKPGFYEMKHYGFEYRSLPATINIMKVVKVLKSLKEG